MQLSRGSYSILVVASGDMGFEVLGFSYVYIAETISMANEFSIVRMCLWDRHLSYPNLTLSSSVSERVGLESELGQSSNWKKD